MISPNICWYCDQALAGSKALAGKVNAYSRSWEIECPTCHTVYLKIEILIQRTPASDEQLERFRNRPSV